ncbi:MAG: TonB-dependent receptor [Bacteroidaceae bacterium]|nr:TonB-dependent receptor [Bacteroidaceae bacterium]
MKPIFAMLPLVAALSFVPCSSSAQTVIEGTVTDSLGQAVDAFVTVGPKGTGGILKYADTDAKGHYRLEFRTTADSLTVTASGLTIGNRARIVANRSQRVDFRVREQQMELKEVTVKADKIRQHGDTLSYLVGAYQQQGDRVIGDVLKRMPGIEVSESGAIKFNGKAIKKFYVEDMDLLQGRYGLATNNINASDVASVQVLEHHQPIKALQDKGITDDVVINLKLKNSAKGTVAVNTMVGAGWQQSSPWRIGSRPLSDGAKVIGQNPLWAAEVVGMYFAKRRQNMSLYKGNNTGDDVSAELTSHYSSINSVGLYPFCPTNAVLPSGAGLSQKRTFDNHSHIATMNHLEKAGKDSEVTVNVAYRHDDIRREGTSESDRFVTDDTRLLTTETLTSRTHLNDLSGNLRYMWNAKDGFLANVVKFDGSWNDDHVEGLLNSQGIMHNSQLPAGSNQQVRDYGSEAVHQHFDRPSLAVSNTTNLIKNIGKHTLDLHFSAGYAQRPNTLTVGVDSLSYMDNSASIANPQSSIFNSQFYRQDIESRHIDANFHTNYNFRFGFFTLAYGVIANASLHGITTDLDGFVPPVSGRVDSDSVADAPSLRNDLWYNTYELTLGQHYKWERGSWRISLGCPLNLYTQTLDDRVRDDRHGYVHLLVSPNFSTSYDWRDWSGSVSVSYYRNVGDPGGIYSGYIMSNYRTFQRSYVEQLSETDRVGTSASIGYRSALNALFFRLNASYNHTRDNQIYGYTYEGATSVVQAVNQATTSDSYKLGFDFSKGFDWLQTTLRAFGGYGHSHSEQLVAGQLYPFNSRTISLGAGGTITPLPWLNFVLSSGYSWNTSRTDSGSSEFARTIRSATQRLSMNFYVTKRMTLAASVEDNYTNLTATHRHAWFGDVKAKYKIGRCDLELQLNNLFDQRRYTRVTYSGLDIYTHTSQLRPRNVLATVRFKLL